MAKDTVLVSLFQPIPEACLRVLDRRRLGVGLNTHDKRDIYQGVSRGIGIGRRSNDRALAGVIRVGRKALRMCM